MSENKNKEIKKEETDAKLKISSTKLALIITAAILAVAVITVSIVLIVNSVKKDKNFDYLTSDLSKYLEFTEDHKNFKIDVDIAKPHDIDVQVAILNMLYNDRSEKPLYDGNAVTSAITITPADVVHIWYRGYILDEDGKQISVEGMSNFSDSAPYQLAIGSNSFVPGFELGLVGVNTANYPKFAKVTSGKVKDNQVLYVSYKLVKDQGGKLTEANVSGDRIDLSGDVDAIYGEGFKAKLMKMLVGGGKTDVNTTGEGVSYYYTNLTIDFATECENNNPIVVETYFPYDYSKTDLRNETAYFEVYVDKAVIYDTPELTDEYLTEKIEKKEIAISLEEINKHEGATLVDRYIAFAEATMEDIYQMEYDSLVEEAVWNHYLKIVKIDKYPPLEVEAKYKEYLEQLNTQYVNSGGQIYNSQTGQYDTYTTLETYAVAYFGLAKNANYKEYLVAMAQNFVKEKIVLYYLLRSENLVPTKSDLDTMVAAMREEYINDYIEEYLDYQGKTKEDYTEEEYAEFVNECRNDVLSYYNQQYFEEQAYYRIVAKVIIQWPDVVTLDERRAYPLTK